MPNPARGERPPLAAGARPAPAPRCASHPRSARSARPALRSALATRPLVPDSPARAPSHPPSSPSTATGSPSSSSTSPTKTASRRGGALPPLTPSSPFFPRRPLRSRSPRPPNRSPARRPAANLPTQAAAAAVREQFGRVDLLLNCSGVLHIPGRVAPGARRTQPASLYPCALSASRAALLSARRPLGEPPALLPSANRSGEPRTAPNPAQRRRWRPSRRRRRC